MGEELRKEIKNKTRIGRIVEPIILKGDLVPSDITNRMVMDAVMHAKKGIILDGYPRNDEQLEFVKDNFRNDHKIDYAIELGLSEKDSIKRISTRRVCPKCGRNYNTIWIKPKTQGICDVCKTKLVHRDDDKIPEIKRRLAIYNKETLPLKKYYKKTGVLRVVDGSGTIAQVNKAIMDILENGR
jgi:adenylate kinase